MSDKGWIVVTVMFVGLVIGTLVLSGYALYAVIHAASYEDCLEPSISTTKKCIDLRLKRLEGRL